MGLGFDTLDGETREFDRQLHEGAKRYDRGLCDDDDEDEEEDED